MSAACHAAEKSVILTSKGEVLYSASITVTDLGKDTDGKKLIGYKLDLSSAVCKTTLSGKAKFTSKTDDMEDDSAFLQDGDTVKTNVFKDHGGNGDVTIMLDVESKSPRYAGVDIANAHVVSGGCIKDKGVGWNFFKWKAL
ncbi:hypothetical protein D7S89_20565 [Trinickia fusca]|uniref:Uncharacterized protein n=1 Tax=Trinickia fusca TaxID=2419777 RepID=A0A494XAT8_9BURK|nr:hypothetical protein D7S89_20565 [Trinickia fusca]